MKRKPVPEPVGVAEGAAMTLDEAIMQLQSLKIHSQSMAVEPDHEIFAQDAVALQIAIDILSSQQKKPRKREKKSSRRKWKEAAELYRTGNYTIREIKTVTGIKWPSRYRDI